MDGETGLTYFGARYLDAEVGSWTATDPMGQYHNSYSFVGGDPVNLIDLWGLKGEDLPPVKPKPGDKLHDLNNIDIKGKGSRQPEPGPVFYVSPTVHFEVETSTPEIPAPAPLGPLDLALVGIDRAQAAVDQYSFQRYAPKVFSDTESGGFRNEKGKVSRGKVAKATLIFAIGVLLEAEGRLAKGMKAGSFS